MSPFHHLIVIAASIVAIPIGAVFAEREIRDRNGENILLYQRDSGGWPKNYDRSALLSDSQRHQLIVNKSQMDSTIDNGATYSEIRILARAYRSNQDERYENAMLRGIEYLLKAQYDSGGWPQRYPNPQGYSKHITFNDGAMIGVMSLLREIAQNDEPYLFVPESMRTRCDAAVQRGIQCIQTCQIVVRGRRTAWCAQHDENTFEPRKARSYELPSLSGSESVGIVRFLMQIEQPTQDTLESIEAAIAWFEKAQLKGIKEVRVTDKASPKGFDKRVIADPAAPPMWARFYDIQTNKPIFCSRDGVPKSTLAEISYERRNGYSWLGHYASDLLDKEYPAWRKRTN